MCLESVLSWGPFWVRVDKIAQNPVWETDWDGNVHILCFIKQERGVITVASCGNDLFIFLIYFLLEYNWFIVLSQFVALI